MQLPVGVRWCAMCSCGGGDGGGGDWLKRSCVFVWRVWRVWRGGGGGLQLPDLPSECDDPWHATHSVVCFAVNTTASLLDVTVPLNSLPCQLEK